MNRLLLLLLGIVVMFGFTGCETLEKRTAPTFSTSTALEPNDRTTLAALTTSVTKAQTIANELEWLLEEMQHNDELHEALESIHTARREMLLLWNVVHNELHPSHDGLRKQKAEFEAVLMSYRKGLTILLAGMEKAKAKQVLEGVEQLTKAKQNLDRFAIN